MKVRDVDITKTLRDALPVDSFLFNPSIAHVSGDTYIVSVRSYIHNIQEPLDLNPKLIENTQHPWGTDWNGTDVTYILPMVITAEKQQVITNGEWPLVMPVQDMRVFRFIKDNSHVGMILTYNERYEGYQDLIIKGGDSCDDYCYLIGWSYLLVDINDLSFTFLPGQKPLCMNISNPIEKNWSLWRYDVEKVYLMVSYALTPVQSAFSVSFDGIEDSELVGASTCRMVTERPGRYDNILGKLETYYGGNLLVSLSTPSYATEIGEYQAVGHLKVKVEYVRKLADGKKDTPLAKFAQKYINGSGDKHFNLNYVYLMFVYKFRVVDREEQKTGIIELTGSHGRVQALITHITPAFVCKVDDYDYFLNFPAGMVLSEEYTIISYGNGDASSHLLWVPNDELKEFLIPVDEVSAANFQFLHGEKVDGVIHIERK